ncbi:MAG TPA: alpha/beta fold hydrolase [Burkholderiales bacterium]|nr:alpha/beta fold hydrolase [Burkholderiales bacterium]
MTAHVREAGAGPAVVCLHANASTSGQWRALGERLSGRFRVLAVDAYGAGKSPAWPADARGTLDEELALLQPVLDALDGKFHLVGHSYGAALALKAVLRDPGQVASMALYEPTLFALLLAQDAHHPAVQGIRDAAIDAAAAVERGDLQAAGERFIDYWMGAGAWAAMPQARRAAVAPAMRAVRHWAHALMTEPTPLARFAGLEVPVLYMAGTRSPASSRGVFDLLKGVLPAVQVVEFAGLGHMGPVTHPDLVNEVIAKHLGA